MTRKHGQSKSLANSVDLRRPTPTAEDKAKQVMMPQLGRQTDVKANGLSFDAASEPRKEKKAGPSVAMLPGLGKASRPASRDDRILNVNEEADKAELLRRYRHLVKSPTVSAERLWNYIVLCVRGLHYSTACLKAPSQKFVDSRKVRMAEPRERRGG